MPMSILPRSKNLKDALAQSDQKPLQYDPCLVGRLPSEILSLTGSILSSTIPQQGVCHQAMVLAAEKGRFIVKVACGSLRSQELWAEHTVMQALADTHVPVPLSLAFVRQDDLSFQLREYISGDPMPLSTCADESARYSVISQMGAMLAKIHSIQPDDGWTWDRWLDETLLMARQNLLSGAYDPDDFEPHEDPEAVLAQLMANRPAGGSVCLLHGDYRPKNILWREGQIVSVIDWAFADIGDPYYDLSIFRWYLRDEQEWALFLRSYGLSELDQERFQYFLSLHRFINV